MKAALKALVPTLALAAALAAPPVAGADERHSRGRGGHYSHGYSRGYRHGYYARPYGYAYAYPRHRAYGPRYYYAPPYGYGYGYGGYGAYGYGYYPPPPPPRPHFGIGLYFGF